MAYDYGITITTTKKHAQSGQPKADEQHEIKPTP